MTVGVTLEVPLGEDYHVHSTFSDGASTVTQNAAAADRRGLRRLCMCDHVRQDTAWLSDFVAAVEAARSGTATELVTGVEAKILDAEGSLDLPPSLAGVDLLLIADHQFPAAGGPLTPGEMRTMIDEGAVSAAEVIDQLVAAASRALEAVTGPRPLLAHLFSLLPKMGLAEAAVPAANLEFLARRARQTGALLEINEKWACPSPRTVRAFALAGVPVVAGSDSHDCRDIGVFTTVRRTIDAVAAGSPA